MARGVALRQGELADDKEDSMTKVNAPLARRFLEQALQALQGDELAYTEAMRGPLGRAVQLHREVDTGSAEDPIHTAESSMTLLQWWLESIGAMEPESAESWVEAPVARETVWIPDRNDATSST
jgi:hypothetical protein